MLIDCHAHLYLDEFDADISAVIQRSWENGVWPVINAAIDIETSRKVIEMAGVYPGLLPAVGIHPHSAHTTTGNYMAQLEKLCAEPKVVAIGEIGLDYHWGKTHRQQQLEVFARQLDLAGNLKLPVILHCCDAEGDMLAVVREWVKHASPNRTWMGVRHCFSGNLDTARQYLDMGFMLSFGGYISYPSSKSLPGVIRNLPADCLLLETDCPYLPPQQYRGKRNEPAYLVFTAARMAEILELPFEDIAAVTATNAARVFNLKLDEFRDQV